MTKYRKKPVEVDAIKFDGTNYSEIIQFTDNKAEMTKVSSGNSEIVIKTIEGEMIASSGDYIIRGIQGEFYPCKPDIFEQTYEKVNRSDK